MAISQKVKKEYFALVAELNKHNDLYHKKDSPEISDQEYDQLFKRLLFLESEFSNIKAYGGTIEGLGPVISGNNLYIISGYQYGGNMPGNVLLSFKIKN